MTQQSDKFTNILDRAVALTVMVLAALIYFLTADPSASFWDCPEYITCASLLEVGHPPGNPMWMLAMRAATIPFPPRLHPLVINICSGFFMALAAFLLCKIIFRLAIAVFSRPSSRLSPRMAALFAAFGAFGGAMTFAVTDSAWYSAVEAEVYAMSTFLSALSVWLMIVWGNHAGTPQGRRILILIAYIIGISLGVHQLNLLVIPVLALIYYFRINPQPGNPWKVWGVLVASFAIVALILFGIMNGSLVWASRFELFAVNTLGLPYFSGPIAYAILLIILIPFAAIMIPRMPSYCAILLLANALWFSGAFLFGEDIIFAGILSLAASIVLILCLKGFRRYAGDLVWSVGFILLGFSSFALILARGYAAPPMNESPPTDIFALSSYIARDQYGSTPLFYGPTPYSKPVLLESYRDGDTTAVYSHYLLEKMKPVIAPYTPGARVDGRSMMMTGEDTAANMSVARSGHGYLLADYSFRRVMTPELNMLFPRITSSNPSDIESYSDWAGMDKGNMTEVEISEAIDTLGNFVAKKSAGGKRVRPVSYRPTYLQNLRYFLAYQVGYMYFRYLMWNFVGRQNDIPSTGEIEHGNFITGIPAIDNAMLGDQSLLPPEASQTNKGRNAYFGIPLIIGIVGIAALFRGGKAGKRVLAVVALLFLMTGLAIVVYLNQTPGEPRERDYSFIGSYMAFSIWIGFGIIAICKGVFGMTARLMARHGKERWRRAGLAAGCIVAIGLPAFMFAENLDDHNRRGRGEPLRFARDVLEYPEPSIIFTQGDNFTFPLWYAQEVMGIGERHAVIDVSYLALPSYVINLMKQGDKGVRLTATPADIAYGAYSFVKISPDASSVPVALIDALRELYAQKAGAPELLHSKVFIPGRNPGDTLFIDLRDLAGGKSTITFRQLMLLDIVATNLEEAAPRPVAFMKQLRSDFRKPLGDTPRPDLFADVYYPLVGDSVWYAGAMSRWGHAFAPVPDPEYADPLLQQQTSRQRAMLIGAAKTLSGQNRHKEGAELLSRALRLYPFSKTPPGSVAFCDTNFHEAIELRNLISDLSEKDVTVDTLVVRESEAAVARAIADSRQWKRYYLSLPESRRATVSSKTMRKIAVGQRLESDK